jgi:cation transporter family protein
MIVYGVLLLSLTFVAVGASPSVNHKSTGFHELSDKEILDHLLHKQRYDKRIKPPVEGSLDVNVSVVLLSLSSPDESSLHYEVEFLMHLQWFDPRLIHDDGKRYAYLNAIHHHTEIWKPDVYFIKHGTFKGGITPHDLAVHIHRNGTVLYTMRRHLVLNCEGDLHIFPFDSPMCSFSIESVSFTRDQMSFFWAGPNAINQDSFGNTSPGVISLSPVLKSHNAYIVHNETLYCKDEHQWRGDYSCLKIKLHFTRDKVFYWITVFIPGIILVTSSFLSFWLEWNAVPARVMLGVTTMLNYFTTSNGFRSNLPVVSNLTAMNMWDGVCMTFIYASFIEFCMVNYLARWVQDPDIQKKDKENAILQSLNIVTSTLTMKNPSDEHTLGGQLHQLGGRLEKVKQKIPADLPMKISATPLQQNTRNQEMLTEDSTVTVVTTCGKFDSENDQPRSPTPPVRPAPTKQGSGRYNLHFVVKIDNYSRRLFPMIYGLFVLYFFVRYHAIEGALSIEEDTL